MANEEEHLLLFSRVRLFTTARTATHQAYLSLTISWSLPKFISVESVMPSNHLIPSLLMPSIFRSIRVFSYESALHIRLPKYWSFSISPSNEYSFIEDNCFTILCWFLLCINTNRPKVYICTLPLELFHLPLL